MSPSYPILTAIVLLVLSPFLTTYYVRPNGGTPQQCNGRFDVDYSPEVAPNCALKSPQDAVNTSVFGDTLQLQAGSVFQFTAGLNLTNKGTPVSTARDCGADRILLTTNDLTGTPSALFNYPAQKVRITAAMAARMPQLVSLNGMPAIWVNRGAKCWVVERFNITSAVGAGTVRLVGMGEAEPRDVTEFPDRNTFRYNWLHPAEETGELTTAATLNRSAESAFYMEGTRMDIHHNAIQGFIRKYPDGSSAASAGVLGSTWIDDFNIYNNLIEAWTYSWFFGGGGKSIALPDRTGTVSHCTTSACDFSNVAGLVPQKPVAVRVYTYTDSSGIFREVWGTARVASISGSTVGFTAPFCWSGNDPTDNTCLPFNPATSPQKLPTNGIPPDGAPARWDGLQPQRIHIYRNYVNHPQEWTGLMGGNCGGKGYYEIKAAKDSSIIGNIFEGCTGGTLTVRNQAGADPWHDVDNLEVAYNWFKDGNGIFVSYLNDGRNLTERSKNVRFHDNLLEKVFTNPGSSQYFQVVAGVFTGGENTSVVHNTMLGGKYLAFISSADEQSRMIGLVNRDNFFLGAPSACYTDPRGIAGAPITACWPDAVVKGNVLIQTADRTLDELKPSWFDPYPSNSLAASLAAVGFTNPSGPSSLDNFKLLATSPYKGKASDGKDVGADIEAMKAMIFGSDTSLPTPSPTPSNSPSPVASPSVTPTPSPTPISSPSPSPAPTPPAGTVKLSGAVFSALDGTRFNFTKVVMTDSSGTRKEFSTQDGAYSFNVAPGSYQIDVEQQDYNSSPSLIQVSADVSTSGLSILNFTVGPNSWFKEGAVSCIPGPCGGSPSPTPTPSATPTPTPTPVATPVATPTPSPAISVLTRIETTAKVNIRSGPTISSASVGVANTNSRGWTTGTRLKDQFSALWFIFVGFDDGRSGFVADAFVRNK